MTSITLKRVRRVLAVVAAAALLTPLAACGSGGETTVKVATRADYYEIYKALNEELEARGEHIRVENDTYDSSIDTSQLLVDNDIDIAATVHTAALKQSQEKNPKFNDVVRLDYIHVQGLALYSKKYKSLDEIPDGATIAILQDAINQSRSLHDLESAGLIKVNPDVTYAAIADVTSNPKNLKFKEITTQLQVRTLDDVDAGLVYTTQAYDGKLDPKTALWSETTDFKKNPGQRKYANIFTVRKEDQNNETYKKVVDAYHSERVYKAYIAEYDGALVPVDHDGNAVDLSKYR